MPTVIPQIEPWIDEREFLQIQQVLESAWLVEGPKTEEFERRFAAWVGCRHAVAVNNATVALYISLRSLGVGEGHEIILPDFTFIATLNAVTWTGARPVLTDIDERTFNIDPQKVREAITPRTRVVIPVHLYGQSADMEAIMDIARDHDLLVIEDASESIGCRFQGRHVGAWGQAGCFSFYGNKTITTGQGGMITTDDENVWRGCFALKNHGRQDRGTFIHPQVGYNFAFTDLQAAVGLAQMSKLTEILRRKERNDNLYRKLLADVEGVRFPPGDPRCQAISWFTNILVDDPQALERHLAAADIGSRRLFYPLHRQPCYQGWFEDRYPATDRIYARGLSLPSSATLTTDQIEQVCGQIRVFLGIKERP
jgi:perosamine synthetase